MNGREERQLWYVSVCRPREGRYEATVRDRAGTAYFHETAPGEDAMTELIRMLEPQRLAEIEMDPTTGAAVVKPLNREPNETIDDLIKQAQIQLEEPRCKTGMIVAGWTFERLQETVQRWRGCWSRPATPPS